MEHLLFKSRFSVEICLGAICIFFLTCSTPKSDFDIVSDLEKTRITEEAHSYLGAQPITITSYIAERSAGSIHDFYSEGDYWWPNPKYPDSAYIRKDGLSNPDNFVAHRKVMIRLSLISGALASAYLVTEDEKYIEALLPHLKAWFVNPDTKMNPNLLYAQAIKGRVTGRGIGIIDTIHLIEVAKAARVVGQSKLIAEVDFEKIKQWFSDYTHWLTTHSFGEKERDNGNNHSVCWAMQVAAFAELTEDENQLEYCRMFFKDVLLPEQMTKDGSFPKELSRTKPYGYSIFNLDAMFGLAQIVSTEEDNLFFYNTENGKNLKLGLEFLYPYLDDKSKWPYQKDVMYWEDWPTKQPSILFGALQYSDVTYLELWERLPEISGKQEILRNMPIRHPMLWIKK
ncbi:alginate lyase family protein [Winogradskyella flava]|uniref:alginate lyase family protein n=1 Tax=Winogradskyella flava TaxID=1884876 RepID=UPI00248FA8C7|nr:alginate lyase family protein [Winogradskyella flava]